MQKEMTPGEGVSADEIKPFMCGLIKAGRGANALYNHTFILIHIEGEKKNMRLELRQIFKKVA